MMMRFFMACSLGSEDPAEPCVEQISVSGSSSGSGGKVQFVGTGEPVLQLSGLSGHAGQEVDDLHPVDPGASLTGT